MAVDEYDAILIGGGHNGLVSAAYFGRAGARTLVLEARDRVGGAADTSAPFSEFPEVKVSTYSYVVSVLPQHVTRDLELKRHGLHLYPVWGGLAPFPDGRSIESHNDDLQRSCESISQFSKRDAEIYPEWQNWIRQAAAIVGPLLMQALDDIEKKHEAEAKRVA